MLFSRAALGLALATFLVTVDAKDVTCTQGKKTTKVILNEGDSFSFDHSGTKYAARQKCRVNYKLGTCTAASVSCDDFQLTANSACRGDFISLISKGTTAQKFCRTNAPEDVAFTKAFSVLFKSNGRKSGSFSCDVSCTSGPGVTTEAPATTGGNTIEPGTCKCGIANQVTKIVGGVESEENEYPWQIGLTSEFGSTPYCGGSIISKKEILTAAHCTDGTKATKIYVLVGEHDVSKADGERKMKVCSKKEHANYNSNTVDYDFAILTLCDEITFAKDASPVCLPTTSGQATGFNEGKASVVSGWGTLKSNGNQPDILMEATVNTMSNSQCTASDTQYSSSDITKRMLCAAASGKDSCQGDSGGPLTTKVGSNYFQIGVVSWGFGCALDDAPGVYARVTNQLTWIKDNMAAATCPSA